MKCVLLVLVIGLFAVSLVVSAPWMNLKLTPRQRAEQLLKQMTFDEKLSMVHGYGGPYVGNVLAVPRLKIPPLTLEDGPQGVGDGTKLVTCWPSALTVQASFDVDMMNAYGKAMGKEQREKGTNIMLGPMVNILRVPVDGRSFESLGEDPYLSSKMAASVITGVQSNGIMATVKHLVDNNQEYNRTTTSANLDERTQYEIYLPAFKAAIDAGVGAIMCSYNRVNDVYACQNNDTLNTAVKVHFGFQGFIMSDWGACHSTVDSANHGLDMEMPDSQFFGDNLKKAIQNGEVPMSRLDDMTLRILTSMFAVGIFDEPVTGNLSVNVQSAAHTKLAKELGQAGTVLLKNTGNLLPLNTNTLKSIAVIGDDASLNPIAVGYGSGYVVPPYIVKPLDAITSRAGSVSVKYAPSKNLSFAAQLAKNSDVAIVFVAVDSSEGADRVTLSLGDEQDDLISAVTAAQPNTIVVIHAPGAVLMPWVSSAAAIVYAFLPGQEDGNAIAGTLFGDAAPTGRLPMTIPVKASQVPVNTIRQYPGINNEAEYSEGLLVGYRWYDAKNVAPLFEFGLGLTYTTFSYSNLMISGSVMQGTAKIQFNVRNTGSRDGVETPQMYIGFPSSAGEPPKQLRGFTKVYLTAGQTKSVTFGLNTTDVSIWDVNTHDWSIIRGQFGVFVGASSRNILLTGTITV